MLTVSDRIYIAFWGSAIASLAANKIVSKAAFIILMVVFFTLGIFASSNKSEAKEK